MGGATGVLGRSRERQLRRIAATALEESDFDELMRAAGATGQEREASAALRAVLAERIAEYTQRAMRETKRRRIGLSAAAIIIGSR
jgi:hypothetical protein